MKSAVRSPRQESRKRAQACSASGHGPRTAGCGLSAPPSLPDPFQTVTESMTQKLQTQHSPYTPMLRSERSCLAAVLPRFSRMRPEFPIECRCSHRGEPLQLPFAQKAMQMLPHRAETVFEPTPQGLRVIAETEMALERPLEILRDVFGEQLHVEPPAVRYREGASLEEPHMGLRVLAAPMHFEILRNDLLLRGATIVDAEQSKHFAVLRAVAPLKKLFGYHAFVAQHTSRRGQLVMWLSHYAAVADRTAHDS